jgi:type IV secretory pathway TrbL component
MSITAMVLIGVWLALNVALLAIAVLKNRKLRKDRDR